MGGFCLLVELHRIGSMPAACTAGLFSVEAKPDFFVKKHWIHQDYQISQFDLPHLTRQAGPAKEALDNLYRCQQVSWLYCSNWINYLNVIMLRMKLDSSILIRKGSDFTILHVFIFITDCWDNSIVHVFAVWMSRSIYFSLSNVLFLGADNS